MPSLHWIGKEKVINHHHDVPFNVLYKSNHYPDYILYTQSGQIILLETKGDDRDNSDSQSKCRLGNKWAELAGERFNYFMVFENNQVDGAFSVSKALTLIKEL